MAEYLTPQAQWRLYGDEAQPEPQGPTDEELLRIYRVATPCYQVEEYKRELDFARAVLARWGSHPTPIPVAERLPGPEDCIQRSNDHWCWGQERSSITGRAAARWRLMRVSSLEDEAVDWLPANALPVPAND
jgi:hypothetical protein